MNSLRPLAAEAGLFRSQYMKMTPKDLEDYLEGYIRSQEREWNRAAFIAATMANLFSKKRVKPEKLLGRKLLKYIEPLQPEKSEIEIDRAKLEATPEVLDNAKIGSVISLYRDLHKRTGSGSGQRPKKDGGSRKRDAKSRRKPD